MKRVYYYTPGDLGLAEFPAGLMRLAGFEATPDPQTADVFALPTITHSVKDRLQNLPYLAGNESRHVVWNCADDYNDLLGMGPVLALRCDATKAIVGHEPRTRAWPWPVDDLWAPFEGFEYDVVFQGWASTPLTNVAVDSVRAQENLHSHLETYPFFYGYHYHDPAYAHYRVSFIDTLRRSRLSLVPRSIPAGVIRYRFYEAMSAGRVPVHFNDGRVLPWADKIDYSLCSIHLPESDAANAGPILAEWLAHHHDDDIRAMGAYGRAMWQRWLAPDDWDERFAEAVTQYLGIP